LKKSKKPPKNEKNEEKKMKKMKKKEVFPSLKKSWNPFNVNC